jgi:transposase
MSHQSILYHHPEALIGYFEWLFTTVYPTQTVVLVIDNASFHHSAALQAALAWFDDRLLLVWLPPYLYNAR